MDHIRKRRWVRYGHLKCKMYLRNDFQFKCAYCGMREQDTGVQLEDAFEKDHFVAVASKQPLDHDAYDNMVYACSKCNGTKSNMSISLLLDPCKDDIYSGNRPHVQCLGENGYYRVIGNTPEGCQYIKSLKLNAKFYRDMRKQQEQSRKNEEEIKRMVDRLSRIPEFPENLGKRLQALLQDCFSLLTPDQMDDAYRCGKSKAGLAFQKVLFILQELAIPYELLFDEDDLDIKIQYGEREYICEIILNDVADSPVRKPRMKREQREKWKEKLINGGILYFYLKIERLELYDMDDENGHVICLKE